MNVTHDGWWIVSWFYRVGTKKRAHPWLLAAVLQTRLPQVVDADALNLLAQEPARRDDWILTPHPGEAARLLGVSTEQIQADRLHAVHALQQRYGGVCVLKGAGTLVCTSESIALCEAGNPGMASGGMGDVLTGIIAGFLAQGLSLMDAAKAGVYIHATAGDRAAQEGERGLLASDLLPHLRKLVNPTRKHSLLNLSEHSDENPYRAGT